MRARPKILATLIAATALAAAPAFSAEVIEYVYYAPPTTTTTTTYYVTEPRYVYTPTVTEVIYEAPAITVEAPRLDDHRITQDVVYTLANDPYLSGRIGVETRDQEVNLSGYVTTPGQVRRAVRDAKSVAGVRNVTSELRSRVGAATSY